jgi:hypothetical protein
VSRPAHEDFRRRLDLCRREYIILRQGSKDYIEVAEKFGFVFNEDGYCEAGTIRDSHDTRDWLQWFDILLR